MLYACHGRVKAFCKQLQILPDYLAQHGINQAVKNDVQQILNYFNKAAPLHHDDEEKDFFPALAKAAPEAQADIDTLESQHHELHHNWALLREQLEALLAGNRDNVDRELIQKFVAGYDVHIAIEEPLFELGKQHLAEDELAAMGKIMAERRSL
ncbi:hypothetical protein A4G20_06880 [Pasteurellaceae bacterium RH1A]|nr:hypothetical protein A4G20_06880 [Pasteurellaceae bacterium RH1A]